MMCTCTKLLIMLYGVPLLMCTCTKLLITLIAIVRMVVFKLLTFVITQRSSATIHLAKKKTITDKQELTAPTRRTK